MTMKEKRHLEVLLETHEVTTISFKRRISATFYCQTCGSDSLHLSVTEAASILKFSESAIFRFTESKQVHSMETGGVIRVCGNSLSAFGHERQIGKEIDREG